MCARNYAFFEARGIYYLLKKFKTKLFFYNTIKKFAFIAELLGSLHMAGLQTTYQIPFDSTYKIPIDYLSTTYRLPIDYLSTT